VGYVESAKVGREVWGRRPADREGKHDARSRFKRSWKIWEKGLWVQQRPQEWYIRLRVS
jgi:hypothetical protein